MCYSLCLDSMVLKVGLRRRTFFLFQNAIKWVLPPQVSKREPDVGGGVVQRKERCLHCSGEPTDTRAMKQGPKGPHSVSTRPQLGCTPLALLSTPSPPNFTSWLQPAGMGTSNNTMTIAQNRHSCTHEHVLYSRSGFR